MTEARAAVFEDAIAAAADPASARTALERLVEGRPELAARLATDELSVRGFVALVDASRSLGEAAIADPSLLDCLGDPDTLAAERRPERYAAEGTALVDGPGLRRWKQRELARTALRDLLGWADLASVGRELAGLADACLVTALRLARTNGPGAPDGPAGPAGSDGPDGSGGPDEAGDGLAIVAMGKLGGSELNYASDVDVLFVHDGDRLDGEEAVRIARRLLGIMNGQQAGGAGAVVFRTDADLRPEGRAGTLSRSLTFFGDYYRNWAGHWERQALIKSRAVAGDAAVAGAFFDAVLPTLWDSPLDPDALRELRQMKARSEARRANELKRGPGGIRDVEFAVQLLQFVHGRHDKGVRSPNTLEALDQLSRGGYLDPADAEHLAIAYRYLRRVEHLLQLRDEQQVYALPEPVPQRTRLARVLGYRDRPDASALEQFEATHRRHLASVRDIHERLFFRPLLDAMAGRGPLGGEDLGEQLAAFGFRDSAATRAAIDELTAGMGRTARQFQNLMPLLLEWLSATPDPDLGLLQLRTVADGPVRAGAVVAALRDSAAAGPGLCRLLGASKVVGRALRRHPEALADLTSEQVLAEPKLHADLVAEAGETLGWRAGAAERRRDGLRRFVRREELRIACRDLLGHADARAVAGELSDLAEATLEALLEALRDASETASEPAADTASHAASEVGFPFVVIGMGKLGGAELSYASDLDVLFVHDGPSEGAERLAETIIRDIGSQTAEGRAWEIDARLRPEGRAGALALRVDGYRSYWAERARLWERQALVRARPVAGDPGLAARFEQARIEMVYRRPLDEDEAREIRRMKARVETERIRPPDDPAFHLKLGPGALADVEWTVQLLQLRAGADDPSVRTASTLAGLEALVAGGYLDAADGELLAASYRFCERARNARYLHLGAKADSLPTRPQEAAHLGRMLGFDEQPETSLRETYRQVTRRARAVVERVFYDRRNGGP